MNLSRKIPNLNFILIFLLLLLNFITFVFYLSIKNSTSPRFSEKFSLENPITKNDNSLNITRIKSDASNYTGKIHHFQDNFLLI